jgi:hypothetical protein
MTPNARRHADAAKRIRSRMGAKQEKHDAEMALMRNGLGDRLLQANRAGATYDELVEYVGVSDGWLCQLIRSAKTATSRPAARARRARTSSAA